MTAASQAIEQLVADVRLTAAGHEIPPREALGLVLDRLDVVPGDPAWADGRDVVGEAYERLVTTTARRPLGQFFTPLWAARPIAEWLLAEPADLLLDPGCGSAALLIAANVARADMPTKFLGLDSDPLALRLAAMTRHVRAIADFELRHTDFLLDDIPERPEAVICNPPYTRHQDVPAATKAAIHDGLAERLGRDFSRLASMHVLFLLRALEVAADGARIAFLTPAHWLDMNYATAVKELVLERAHVEALITFPVEESLFSHAVTTAGVTLLRKEPAGQATARIVRLPASDKPEADLRAAIWSGGDEIRLRATQRWSRAEPRPKSGDTVLADVARVRRGIATGCNAFFVLSERRRLELDIPRSDLKPCIASPRHFSGSVLDADAFESMDDGVPRWLLNLSEAPRSGPTASYLRRGRTEFGVRDRTLVHQRVRAGRKWFQVELDVDGPILFRYFNASAARFVRNTINAAPLNNWLVIQPKPGVDADSLFELLTAVGGSASLRDGSRHYGKGLWKLEPRELRQLALPPAAAALRLAAEAEAERLRIVEDPCVDGRHGARTR